MGSFSPNSIGPAVLRQGRGTVLAAAAALGLAVLASGSADGVERSLWNLRDSILSHDASGEVHIVEIDARSLAAIDKWPWPRGVHADIVDRLAKAGVRSIAFDVDFSSSSEKTEDAKLAAALDRADGKVVLSTFRQQASASDLDYIDAVPIPALADRSFLAAVNVVPDDDGYIRRMLLGLETAGVPRPSLASMVAEKRAKIGLMFDIDFAIEPSSIPRHSVIDLLENRVSADEIRGKRIVIGATAVEMGDRYAVPRHSVIPGVVIQAMAAETLLQGPVPQRMSGIWALAATLLLIVFCLRFQRRSARIASLTATAALVLVVPIVMASAFAITLLTVPALASLLAVAVAGAIGWVFERFQHRAHTDSQSGLPNLSALQHAAREADQVSVVVARIEGFPTIMSALGPEVTATFINRVADRLRFSGSVDVIYRTEEANLAWIAPPDDDLNDRIEAISAMMRSPIECGRLVDASLSFGVDRRGGYGIKQAVANAALAALKASESGERWIEFSAADGIEANSHLNLLGELESALRDGQIWNAYQPKLDIASGRIVGAEALVRWQHPRSGAIQPDVFVPVIEKAGRIRDLTLHVLHQALDDAVHWQKQGHDLGVAVNVSANLLADHEFIELVGQALCGRPLPADKITIEVTESAALAMPERAVAALESWRSLGVHISIDDYGTGQSSLAYLQTLPASELKIDRSFVTDLRRDARNAAMVRSTISLAHELGMSAVAEGVEDEDCLAALAEMGCDRAQGYLIGRPGSSESLLRLVSERLRPAA